MPYTDPQHKQDWERQHRTQRLARRRELRRIEKTRLQSVGTAAAPESNNSSLVWVPILVGGALAAYDPKLAIGAGSLTLLAAAIGKQRAAWWIVGAIILVIGLLTHLNGSKEGSNESSSWSGPLESET